MTQFAMHGSMHEITKNSIQYALFDAGEFELEVSDTYNDIGLEWADKENLSRTREQEKNDGLFWDAKQNAQGILWGGCVESLIAQVAAEKFLPTSDDITGTVLCIETAEDIPEPWIVEYLLIGFGERGWFDLFEAVLVGRPKAWHLNKQNSKEVKAEYAKTQRDTVLRTVREYNKTIPIIQNLDFGHTDPQTSLPMGNKARIDSENQKIYLTY